MAWLMLFTLTYLKMCGSIPVPMESEPTNSNTNVNEVKRYDIAAPTTPKSLETFGYDIFKVKNYGREEAVREDADKLSKLDTAYARFQNYFPVEPVVDTSRESDKYGNDGSISTLIGTGFIGIFDKFANIVNTAIEVPKIAKDKVVKNINTVLGSYGAKLLG